MPEHQRGQSLSWSACLHVHHLQTFPITPHEMGQVAVLFPCQAWATRSFKIPEDLSILDLVLLDGSASHPQEVLTSSWVLLKFQVNCWLQASKTSKVSPEFKFSSSPDSQRHHLNLPPHLELSSPLWTVLCLWLRFGFGLERILREGHEENPTTFV